MSGTPPNPLDREMAAFQRLLPSLLEHQGKFAVILGDQLIGVFNDYEDALKAGYGAAKFSPFLVKRISQTESAQHFSRDFGGTICPT